MTLKTRLAFLETDARPAGGVVVYRHGESQDAAMARAYAAGVRGGVLLVPQVLTAEQWAPMACEQQAALLAARR